LAGEDIRRIPSKGWAAMIRKIYEVDPTACPKCGGRGKCGLLLIGATFEGSLWSLTPLRGRSYTYGMKRRGDSLSKGEFATPRKKDIPNMKVTR